MDSAIDVNGLKLMECTMASILNKLSRISVENAIGKALPNKNPH